jgi:TRAP-type mannitol/chloroaromatic compound transport system substrate-binding protein
VEFRQALPIGTILAGDYRITDVLGQGGFGLTYKADDLRLGAPAAIKEYFPGDLALREPGRSTVVARSPREEEVLAWGRAKFLDEAKTLARFRHPNIVRVARLFEANNTAYMVLDFEMGPSLSAWRQALGRAPSQAEIDRIAAKLLAAVEAVHAEGILHRDIKPANVIMRDGAEPVLIDFGAARQALSAQSRTVHAIVTPGYSPKEQYAVDLDRQGAWSDIYALGATFYFLVTGKAPPDALSRDLDEPMPMAAESAGSYRQGFLAAIDAAMSVSADQRPQSVAAWRPMLLGPASPGSGGLAPPARTGREASRVPATAAPSALIAGAGAASVRRVTFDDIPSGLPEAPGRPKSRAATIVAASLVAGLLALGGLGYWIAVLAPERDNLAWSRAQSANTAEAYARYLAEQPSGRHVASARERQAALARPSLLPTPASPAPAPTTEPAAPAADPPATTPAAPAVSPRPAPPPPPEPAAAKSPAVTAPAPSPAPASPPKAPAASAPAAAASTIPERRTLPAALSDAEAQELARSVETVQWRLATAVFTGSQVTGFSEQQGDFAAELARLSGGRLEARTLRDAEAVPREQVLRRVREEAGLMGWHAPALLWRRHEFAVFAGAVPFGLAPADHVRWMRAEGAHLLERAYAASGSAVRAIPCGIAGSPGAWFRKEVRSPSDFRDLRVYASPLVTDAMRKLGSTAADVASQAALAAPAAVDRVDAVLWVTSLTAIFLTRSPPLTVYHFPSAHNPSYLFDLVVGAGTWGRMSEAQRRLLDDACRRNLDHWATLAPSSQNSVLTRIRQQRITVRPFTGPVREALQKAVDEVLAEDSAKNPRFKEAIDSYNRFRR